MGGLRLVVVRPAQPLSPSAAASAARARERERLVQLECCYRANPAGGLCGLKGSFLQPEVGLWLGLHALQQGPHLWYSDRRLVDRWATATSSSLPPAFASLVSHCNAFVATLWAEVLEYIGATSGGGHLRRVLRHCSAFVTSFWAVALVYTEELEYKGALLWVVGTYGVYFLVLFPSLGASLRGFRAPFSASAWPVSSTWSYTFWQWWRRPGLG